MIPSRRVCSSTPTQLVYQEDKNWCWLKSPCASIITSSRKPCMKKIIIRIVHYNHDEHKVENIILLSSRTYTSSFELSPVRWSMAKVVVVGVKIGKGRHLRKWRIKSLLVLSACTMQFWDPDELWSSSGKGSPGSQSVIAIIFLRFGCCFILPSCGLRRR